MSDTARAAVVRQPSDIPAASGAQIIVLDLSEPSEFWRIVDPLPKTAPDPIIVVATDPVDILTYQLLKAGNFDPKRVMGIGTISQTLLFRKLISRRCRVAEDLVQAFIIGQHGGQLVPLWSSASIATIPLHQWAVPGHGKLSIRDRTDIFQEIKQQPSNKHEAIEAIFDAIAGDQNRILPIAVLLQNYMGISDVCLAVPTIVNRNGAEVALPIVMNAAEEAGLKQAAEAVHTLTSQM